MGSGAKVVTLSPMATTRGNQRPKQGFFHAYGLTTGGNEGFDGQGVTDRSGDYGNAFVGVAEKREERGCQRGNQVGVIYLRSINKVFSNVSCPVQHLQQRSTLSVPRTPPATLRDAAQQVEARQSSRALSL